MFKRRRPKNRMTWFRMTWFEEAGLHVVFHFLNLFFFVGLDGLDST